MTMIFLPRHFKCLVAAALCVAAGTVLAADTAYLRSDDQVLCCGDSITAPGTYQKYVQEVLQALYPGNTIALINLGSGGKSAEFGADSIQRYAQAPAPSLALFMFGVNDTGWRLADVDKKVATFTASLQKAAAIAAKKQIALVLLRETHFSHGANPASDAFELKVTATLDQLQAAQATTCRGEATIIPAARRLGRDARRSRRKPDPTAHVLE